MIQSAHSRCELRRFPNDAAAPRPVALGPGLLRRDLRDAGAGGAWMNWNKKGHLRHEHYGPETYGHVEYFVKDVPVRDDDEYNEEPYPPDFDDYEDPFVGEQE